MSKSKMTKSKMTKSKMTKSKMTKSKKSKSKSLKTVEKEIKRIFKMKSKSKKYLPYNPNDYIPFN
jgi:hypothetical protein